MQNLLFANIQAQIRSEKYDSCHHNRNPTSDTLSNSSRLMSTPIRSPINSTNNTEIEDSNNNNNNENNNNNNNLNENSPLEPVQHSHPLPSLSPNLILESKTNANQDENINNVENNDIRNFQCPSILLSPVPTNSTSNNPMIKSPNITDTDEFLWW